MRKTNLLFDREKLKDSGEVLRAVAHPLRMKILEFIDEHQSIPVNKIYNTLKLEQSITSQHLRILRRAGIVKTDREGKFVKYSIDYAKLGKVRFAIKNFLSSPSENQED